jgi:DNA-binding XRE family transcriptional regulator
MQQFTLKELRARKDLTQSEVADKIGVSTQTYNAWEKDVSNVSISKVKALADFFGVTIGEIFLP